VLRAYGIKTASSGVSASEDEAAQRAAELGYPVALKIVSADVVHKTDIGAVRVGIASERELRDASREIIARVTAEVPDARVDGLLVQEMVTDGVETIMGMTRDPSFGPLIMFGLGGVFVEALHDVVFRLAPLNESDALAMTHAIRSTALLDGLRGCPASDRTALAAVLRRIAQLAVDHPEILELDVNPVCARSADAIAVDARLRVSRK
jgi:succinyl-CoA synthetase beta subunit